MTDALCPMCGMNFNKRGPHHKRCLDCSIKLQKQYVQKDRIRDRAPKIVQNKQNTKKDT